MTKHFYKVLSGAIACSLVIASAAVATADGVDILFSSNGSKLITGGFDDGTDSVTTEGPLRVYEFEVETDAFTPGGPFTSDDPGLQSVQQSELSTFFALPHGAELSFSALPISIGANTSTLFYWDGSGAVNFLPALVGSTLELDLGSPTSGTAPLTLNGSQMTAQTGFGIAFVDEFDAEPIHTHLETAIGTSGGNPNLGIYLISLEFALTGLDSADPVYLLYATIDENFSLAQFEAMEEDHELAVEWVEANLLTSTNAVPEPGTLLIALIGLVLGSGAIYRRRRLRN